MAALVVEDGTGLVNSQTYAAPADVQTYFNLYGYQPGSGLDETISTALGTALTSNINVLLMRAMLYLESFADRYVGLLQNPPLIDTVTGNITPQQALSWPRVPWYPLTQPYTFVTEWNCFPGAFSFVPPGVPAPINYAQCQLVLEQLNGFDLFQSATGAQGYLTGQKADVFQETYTLPNAPQLAPKLPAVMRWLNPFLNPQGLAVSR